MIGRPRRRNRGFWSKMHDIHLRLPFLNPDDARHGSPNWENEDDGKRVEAEAAMPIGLCPP